MGHICKECGETITGAVQETREIAALRKRCETSEREADLALGEITALRAALRLANENATVLNTQHAALCASNAELDSECQRLAELGSPSRLEWELRDDVKRLRGLLGDITALTNRLFRLCGKAIPSSSAYEDICDEWETQEIDRRVREEE